MTDSIPTPENVTELKPRQKPGPKPKPAPAPKLVEPPLVPAGVSEFEGLEFNGGFKPVAARLDFDSKRVGWNAVNEQRYIDGVLGLDGIIIERAYGAASTGLREDLESLLEVVSYALAVAE